MKRTIIISLLAAVLPFTAASAQNWNRDTGHSNRGYGDYRSNDRYEGDLCSGRTAERLSGRIDALVRSRAIDSRNANWFQSRVANLDRLERNYCRNGLQSSEARQLNQRYAWIERDLRNRRYADSR